MEIEIVEEKSRLVKDFPKDKLLQIKHMLLSHHGKYEFGSPKLPMTLEALVFSKLDDLDAKVFQVDRAIKESLNEHGWTDKVYVCINLVDDIAARYKVDKKRIYLTGLSMGGYGTWALASAYPERFAAIAPICGGGSRIMSLRLKDIPIWVFHGAKDRVVPLEESEEMVNAIRKRGGDVKFTIYPDAGHDSWTESYNNQELYDWFLEHSKQ